MLPGEMGVEILEVRKGFVRSQIKIEKKHLAPNGFLHAAAVIALADTSAGYGCVASLPEGGKGFTTIELKANFLGTMVEGVLSCVAKAEHLGKSDSIVGRGHDERGRKDARAVSLHAAHHPLTR